MDYAHARAKAPCAVDPLPYDKLQKIRRIMATEASPDRTLLQEKIRSQGDVVRQMKRDKKPKEEVRDENPLALQGANVMWVLCL